MKQLLIRPRKRTSILFSKFFTVILLIAIVMITSTILSVLVGIMIFQNGQTNMTILILTQILFYTFPKIFFYATLSFTITTLFTRSMVPFISTILLFMLDNQIQFFIEKYLKSIAKYMITTNLDLRMYESNVLISQGIQSLFSNFTLTGSILTIIVHFMFLLLLAIIIFCKKEIL
ncbi:hypothetical protein FC697_20475 [Bacillus wiedmannii]|nr:hypothetical protein FC697_20475 [Bacillus wiedmannii]